MFSLATGWDGSCTEHPAAGSGAKLGPVLSLENTAAVNDHVCFLQIKRVNASQRSFAFSSWPPPFSRDAAECGEGPRCSITLHFLSGRKAKLHLCSKKLPGAETAPPPRGWGVAFFFFVSFFFVCVLL